MSEVPLYLSWWQMLSFDMMMPLGCQFENNYFAEMCNDSKAGSYLRLIDFWIDQL